MLMCLSVCSASSYETRADVQSQCTAALAGNFPHAARNQRYTILIRLVPFNHELCCTTTTFGVHAVCTGDDGNVMLCADNLGALKTAVQAPIQIEPVIVCTEIPCLFENRECIDEVCRSFIAEVGRVGLNPPKILGYTFPEATYVVGRVIKKNTPTFTGDRVTFRMCPEVPAGLEFCSRTGVLSGTPAHSANTRTITASVQCCTLIEKFPNASPRRSRKHVLNAANLVVRVHNSLRVATSVF
eukprot:m.917517 g.917517  ORF g.917517 m.917517 type:complete len:242 (-) comp23738_c0_seq73:1064-1789(-)